MSHDLEWWKMYLLDQVGVIRTTHKHCCCSVAKSCLTFCDPMDCNPPGFPVLHYLLEFVKTHVHWVMMPSSYLILCCCLLLLPLIFLNIRVFSNESALPIKWTNYWSFNFNTSPYNEYSRMIFFRIDWSDLLAVQGTLKSLLQHHISKASIFQHDTELVSIKVEEMV